MKKIFAVAVLFFAFLISFGNTEAAVQSQAGRFRGADYADYLKFKEKIKKVILPRYSSLRRFDRPSILKDRSQKETATDKERAVRKFGTRGVSKSVPVVSSKKTALEDDFQDAKAKNISFRVVVPKGFESKEDTLAWDNGALKFQKNSAVIEITATSGRCDGGLTYVRSCLKEKSDAFLKDFQSVLPRMQLDENKSISLNLNEVQITKENIAQLVKLSTTDYEALQLTFFDPVNSYAWVLRMTDPGKEIGIIKNNRSLQRIFSSLLNPFPNKTNTANKRTELSDLFGTRSRSEGGTSEKAKTPVGLTSSEVNSFTATSVPFTLSLPVDFGMISDTLKWSEGEMKFATEDSTFVITATADVCEDDTPSLRRKCTEEKSAQYGKALQQELPSSTILEDENLELQLIDITRSGLENMNRTSSARTDIGRLFLIRMPDKRAALLTFADPITNYIWTIRMEAPEVKTGFLNDVRQRQKVFSSLRFRMEEAKAVESGE